MQGRTAFGLGRALLDPICRLPPRRRIHDCTFKKFGVSWAVSAISGGQGRTPEVWEHPLVTVRIQIRIICRGPDAFQLQPQAAAAGYDLLATAKETEQSESQQAES